jgi:lysophospholipase L1-like esterase
MTLAFFETLKALVRGWSQRGSVLREDELNIQLDEFRQLGVRDFDRNRDHSHPHHNVTNGMRCTGRSLEWPGDSRHVHLLGGSTVYNEECPDELTLAAFLQAEIEERYFPTTYRVLNRGVKGARIIERIDFLLRHQEIRRDDVVVCYFGVNDSGLVTPRGQSWESEFSWLWRICSMARRKLRLELLDWLYEEKLEREKENAIHSSCMATLRSVAELRVRLDQVGAKGHWILQPNALVSLPSRLDVRRAMVQTSPRLRSFIQRSYDFYLKSCPQDERFHDLSQVLNCETNDVYLDWAHLNAQGNQRVAKAIAARLDRDLVSST